MQSRKVSADLIFGRNLEILKLFFSLKALNPANSGMIQFGTTPVPLYPKGFLLLDLAITQLQGSWSEMIWCKSNSLRKKCFFTDQWVCLNLAPGAALQYKERSTWPREGEKPSYSSPTSQYLRLPSNKTSYRQLITGCNNKSEEKTLGLSRPGVKDGRDFSWTASYPGFTWHRLYKLEKQLQT